MAFVDNIGREPAEATDTDTAATPRLVAHVVNAAMAMPIRPAERVRAWMEATDRRFANRCLPLLIANQAGWCLVSAHTLRATWNGGSGLGDVRVEYLSGEPPFPASSHFGHGILTFNVPYLFRTSPGYNLLVRGPANWIKDGATALEGIVETDWSSATFTVNWQLCRPRHAVTFQTGEPIALLVPQRRGELESFHPELRRLEDDGDLAARYRRWSDSRAAFNAELAIRDSVAVKKGWQKHYFQGVVEPGAIAGEHQTKLELRELADRRGAPSLLAGADQVPPASDTITSITAIRDAAGAETPAADPVPGPPEDAARSILAGLIVEDGFIDQATCRALIDVHRRLGSRGTRSDNGYPLAQIRRQLPARFALARKLIGRMIALIGARFGVRVQCDLSLLCALVPGGFQHGLHADNAVVACPRHGDDAAELRRLGCRCSDIVVRPNHTPWRKYSALLYLSGDHRGGDIVFGDGPNVFGGIYRREIRVRPGLLVLSPSSELYFHHTTPVVSGVRYSMNSWFTDDAAHAAREWM